MTADLTIVIPTFNERDNIRPLVKRLEAVLSGCKWNAVFVDDDSPDGTAALIDEISENNPRISCLRRVGRRGLSSACIEGMMSSSATLIAVMDADLQHDETLLPKMFDDLTSTDDNDIIVGSRYMDGGSFGEWNQKRILISRIATTVAHKLVRTELSDPLSGFFMIRRGVFLGLVRRLSGRGFKILLDILSSSEKPLRVVELPFQFGIRVAGESKLDTVVAWEFALLFAEKFLSGWLPVRFVFFIGVGGLGLLVHLATLSLALHTFDLSFSFSQTISVIIAMVFNFNLNNLFTFRDRRLNGWLYIVGLGSFSAVCSVGALINIGIAIQLFESGFEWWASGFIGAAVGSVWNYALTSFITWRE